jgi:hypothetical protein
MNDFQDLPMGFGMALMQNQDAVVYFGSLSETKRQHLINKARDIDSKEEMQAFVDTLKTH